MRAIEIDPAGRMRLADHPVPRPAPGEARVKVELAGICSTDLELRAGYMGFSGIPGHEFVGCVEEAPDSPDLVGRTVVGEINAGCGRCDDCRRGDSRHCTDRTVLGIAGRDGAFAEQLTLPVGCLHPVPGAVPPERAVFAEPAAAAFQILEQVEVEDRRILVMGCGKLGSLCARVLRRKGAQVTVLVRRSESGALLARDGIPVVLNADRGFDQVVEATGHPDGFPRALELVRPRGTIILKSTCASGRPLNLAPVVVDEVTVVGSRCGPFRPALDAFARGDLKPEEMIGGRFPLADFEAAFAAAGNPADPARRKVVLIPGP
jgi:threonine dehydrogenase-like Zn-dependent dehydrogenase